VRASYARSVPSGYSDIEVLTRNASRTVEVGHTARSTDTRTVTKVDTGLGNSLIVGRCEADTNTCALTSTGRGSNSDSRSNIIDCNRRSVRAHYGCSISSVNRYRENLASDTACTVDVGHRACSTDARAITKVDTGLGDSLIVSRSETDANTSTLVRGGRSSNSNSRSKIVDRHSVRP